VKNGYTNKEISQKTGLSPRLIQFYTEEGVVIPEMNAGTGRGRVRRYSEKNLFQFALVEELSWYAVKISTIKSVIEFLETRQGVDFFEALAHNRPILTIQRRLDAIEFKEVTATLTIRESALNLERDVSGLGIDLYRLYQRKCLGMKPKVPPVIM
jgi:DNA-binding transcriptional MerR regulator